MTLHKMCSFNAIPLGILPSWNAIKDGNIYLNISLKLVIDSFPANFSLCSKCPLHNAIGVKRVQ